MNNSPTTASPDSIRRILIVKLSSIGDVIHTLPCLTALEKRFPFARMDWVVEDVAANLLDGHPQLFRLYTIPKKRWRSSGMSIFSSEIIPFFRELRQQRYDVAIDFQGLTKSGLVSYFSGAKRRIGFKGEDSKEINALFMTERVRPPKTAKHVVEKNISLLSPFGVNLLYESPHIHVSPEDEGYIADFFKQQSLSDARDFIALYPGATWETKRWMPENFIELGYLIHSKLKVRILILWGPAEEKMAHTIHTSLQQKGAHSILAPPTTMRQLASLLKRCILFVSPDTGPMQLAAAMNMPVVALFGGSDPERNGPYCEKKRVLWKRDLSCTPCWETLCPLTSEEHLKCLHTITPEEVFEAVEGLYTHM